MSTFLASIIVFGMLIFFHELGHYAVAKRVGMRVHEFSLGFGPKILGTTRGETVYNLRAVPLGGFVRVAGMDPEEEVEKDRSYQDKTILQRMGFIVAGPLMNFVLAAVLLAFIFMAHGMPSPTTQISDLVEGQPAQEAGFLPGDRIVAIEGHRVTGWEEVTVLINERPGREIDVLVARDGRELVIPVVPATDESGLGRIGIYPGSELIKMGPVAAVVGGVEYTVRVTVLIVDFIVKMITGQAPPDLGGPVRIVSEIGRSVDMGVFYLLQLTAFLSINLGLFNLFPIPALDGSRLLFLSIEAVRGKPVDPLKENFIHMVGFGLILLLIVFITYNDVLQLMMGSH